MILKHIFFLFSCLFSISSVLSRDSHHQTCGQFQAGIKRAGCQQFKTHGYKYAFWQRVDAFEFDNSGVKREGDRLTEFQMVISIKAEKDGLILLSPKKNPSNSDLVFEIGVGTDNNKETVLRSSVQGLKYDHYLQCTDTPNILSSHSYTDFIIVLRNGTLSFGKHCEPPYYTYSDRRLDTIQYFSLSSFGEVDAKFLYDCSFIQTRI